MRDITSMQAQWKAQKCTGKNLFKNSSFKEKDFGLITHYGTLDSFVKTDTCYIKGTNSLYIQILRSSITSEETRLQRGFALTLFEDPLLIGKKVRFSFYGKGFEDYATISFYSPTVVISNITIATLENGWKRYSAFLDIPLTNDRHTVFVRPNKNLIYDADIELYINAPQIEENSILTEYEPYCGGNTSNFYIENCKGGYFSTIDNYGLKVIGKTAQNTMAGKNLLEHNISNQTLNGVTFTVNEDKSILVNGTATDNIRLYLQNLSYNDLIKKETNYRISGCPSGGSASTYSIVLESSELDINYSYDSGNGMGYFKYGGPVDNLYIKIDSGTVCNNLLFQPMIELGSIVTSYEPYCGGIPSPNPEYPQEIQCVKAGTKVRCCGKNLLNLEDFSRLTRQEEGIYWSNGLVITTAHKLHLALPKGQYHIGGFIKCPVNANYRFAIYYKDGTKTSQYIESDGDYKWCSFITDGLKEVDYFAFDYGSASNDIYVKNLQLERGTNGTDYESYISNEIITPCDLYEGDIWYPLTGKVERHMQQATITGGEHWEMTRENEKAFSMHSYVFTNDYIASYNNIGYFSNKFIYSEDVWMVDAIGEGHFACVGSAINKLLIISFNKEKVSDIAVAKQLLAQWYNKNTPAIFVVPLATPIIEQYEPQPIFAPQGTVNVNQISALLPADIQATCLVRR